MQEDTDIFKELKPTKWKMNKWVISHDLSKPVGPYAEKEWHILPSVSFSPWVLRNGRSRNSPYYRLYSWGACFSFLRWRLSFTVFNGRY